MWVTRDQWWGWGTQRTEDGAIVPGNRAQGPQMTMKMAFIHFTGSWGEEQWAEIRAERDIRD